MAFVAALGLASCGADRVAQTLVGDADTAVVATAPAKPSVLPAVPGPLGSPGAIAVVPAKTPSESYKDLERCRAMVAASMGPPGVQDDLEALKRALKAHPNDNVVTLAYINDDRAIQRRDRVKSCLSQIGYIAKK